jgi:hypothetical protein
MDGTISRFDMTVCDPLHLKAALAAASGVMTYCNCSWPRPRETFSRNTIARAANHVKCVLAHINSDGGHCVNGGRARHGGAPSPDKPPTHSERRWGRERGRSIPFATEHQIS